MVRCHRAAAWRPMNDSCVRRVLFNDQPGLRLVNLETLGFALSFYKTRRAPGWVVLCVWPTAVGGSRNSFAVTAPFFCCRSNGYDRASRSAHPASSPRWFIDRIAVNFHSALYYGLTYVCRVRADRAAETRRQYRWRRRHNGITVITTRQLPDVILD